MRRGRDGVCADSVRNGIIFVLQLQKDTSNSVRLT